MKFIHSLTQDRQVKGNYNKPVNLDYVNRIYIVDDVGTGTDRYYCIMFAGNHYDVQWSYNDKLVRDNRLEEILSHIGSKGI